MSFFIDEEEYLSHYGRKGMKWYQHIYGDEKAAARSARKAESNRLEQKEKFKSKDQR